MTKPPKLANRFLRAICNSEFLEMIEGDLNEEFYFKLKTKGKTVARLNYWWTVFRSVRPYLLKRNKNPYNYSETMLLKSYLKISYRNLLKQKLYTAINIIGLTAGMASSLLIFLFVRSEMTFDRYHKDVENIYRVTTKGETNEQTMEMVTSPLGLAFKMKSDFPEVEEIARLSTFVGEDRNLLIYGDKKIFQENGYLADSAFFKILTYEFTEGDPNTCLDNSGNVVLSAPVAKKLFGDEPALGKLISIQNSFGKVDYSVTGVYKLPEKNTHLNISFVTSMNNPGLGTYIFASDELLGNNFVYTYLKLRDGTNPENVVNKFPALLDKYAGKQMEEFGFRKSHNLIWVPDIHLKAEGLGFQKEGDTKSLYILSSIALIILVIACINFMNMATAQAGYRSREIGVRKVFGAQKFSLITQFLTESIIITFISLVASVTIVYWIVPFFNDITGKRLSFDLLEPAQLIIALAIGFITGFFAGSYPAFYLSGISIIKVFKKQSNKSGTGLVRKGLVVFQFLISISLIAGVITINRQLNFVQSKSLGFKKENQIAIPLRSPEVAHQYQALKNEIRTLPGVTSVAAGMAYPGKFVFNDNGFFKEGKTSDDAVNIRMNYVDYDFMNTLGVEVIEGRGFSSEYPGDINKRVVLNESAVRAVGYSVEEAVGKKIFANFDSLATVEIVGVVKDFNFQSLYEQVIPYMFIIEEQKDFRPRYLLFSVETNNYQELLDQVKSKWDALAGGIPFEFSFMDQDLDAQYQSDESLAKIVKVFTIIAIIISALGLFALSAYAAENRLKEMGVRKVMGASGKDIFLIMSANFSILIGLAFVLSILPGYYFIDKWLNSFAFRVDISPWIFVLAGTITFLFAILVVSYQCLKVSLVNPVNVLKDE